MVEHRIYANTLIPGRGDPIPNGVVVFDTDDGKISYAGPRDSAPPPVQEGVASIPPVTVDTVMPGMWDCHAHFTGSANQSRHDSLEEYWTTPIGSRCARSVGHTAKVLDAGFTTVREVGGDGYLLAPLIDANEIRGPKIYYAGQIISTTGGHGDHHNHSLECVAGACGKDSTIGYLCDGVPECLKAVRCQLRKGASVIKICTSGGVMSDLDNPQHQQFSDEEIRAMVQEAERADVIVAAHAHGKAGILAALRNGCGTIEHGSYWDDECTELAKEKDAVLVPTRWILMMLKQMVGDRKIGDDPTGTNLTQSSLNKAISVYESHTNAIKLAIASGVTIATGCDLFIGKEYGYNGAELKYLVELGFTPLQAIEAATANGPLTLGHKFVQLRGIKSGQLHPGYDADIIALAEGNPVDDISVLANPKAITYVWKGGTLVKGKPLAGSPELYMDDASKRAGRAYAYWDQA